MPKKLKDSLILLTSMAIIVLAGLAGLLFTPTGSTGMSVMVFVLAMVLLSGMLETGFRLAWRLKYKKPYEWRKPPRTLDELHFEPHPYLTNVYKRNSFIPQTQNAKTLLNPNMAYGFYGINTNSMRIANGPDGTREVAMPKPKDLIRINCIGESTTASYIRHENQVYSMAMELEKNLKTRFPNQNLEVNNFAQGNWNSTDILINFLIHVYDTQPDIVILSCGFNDIPIALSDGFLPDYSHAKQNLAGVYAKVEQFANLMDIPSKLYNFLKSQMFDGVIKVLYDLNTLTDKGKFNMDSPLENLASFKRNFEHIIKICLASNIKVVLITHAHLVNKFNAGMKKVQKYREALEYENAFIRDMAQKYQTGLADNDLHFPREISHYIDSMHPSHLGMQFLGRFLAEPVSEQISQLLAHKFKTAC